MRQFSAAERIGPDGLEPSEDPNLLNHGEGTGDACPPWYDVPPGWNVGTEEYPPGPRFLEGVPTFDFFPNPFLSVSPRQAIQGGYNPGRFRGNTGFSPANGPHELGDLSEGVKTAATGAFLLGATALVLWMYSKGAKLA